MSSPVEKTFRLLCLALFSLIFLSCTKKSAETEKVVHLAIWGNYFSPEMAQKFTQDTGIQLSISNYSSNEELLAKVQMGAAGFDVAVPSDYMVQIMAKMDLLAPLDKAQIPNAKLIAGGLMGQSFDPKNEVSLPYTWTTSGIAVNRELYKGEMKGWKDLLENPELKGKIALLDDSREVMAAALKLKGHSVNTVKPEELNAARDVLLKAKSHVKMFTSDTVDILKNREVVAAQTYSSDALQASNAPGNKIEFVLPSEGSTRAIDNLVLFKKSKNRENALKLINFMISPEADRDRVTKNFSGPVLAQTRDSLPAEIKANTSLFPPEAALTKLVRVQDLEKDNRLYEDIWTAVKSH